MYGLSSQPTYTPPDSFLANRSRLRRRVISRFLFRDEIRRLRLVRSHVEVVVTREWGRAACCGLVSVTGCHVCRAS